MSETRISRLRAEVSIRPTMSRWLSVRRVCARAPAMPITPFSGVRISWLMLARNSLLVRLAVSAISRFSISSRVVASRLRLARLAAIAELPTNPSSRSMAPSSMTSCSVEPR
jgi:hypothetical protein